MMFQFLMLLSIFILSLHRVHADLLVILLEGSQILTSLGELSLLHALSNIPVYMKVIFCLMQDSTWMSK